MSLNLDSQISQWLSRREPNWPQFVEELWKISKDETDIEQLARFCWVEQNFENFAALIRHCLLNDRAVPWEYFCEFLCGFSDRTVELNSALPFMLAGISETNSKLKVCKAPTSIHLGADFKELFLYLQKQARQNFKIEKQTLLADYEMAKFQRLYHEQDRLLKELINRYPKDDQIRSFSLSRDEEIASESLSQHNPFQVHTNSEVFSNQFSSESKKFFDFLMEQIAQKSQSSSAETLYEFAIMFEFFEAPDYALQMMQLYEDRKMADRELNQPILNAVSLGEYSLSEHELNQNKLRGYETSETRNSALRSWRILDLLVANKQWVAALNFADELETRFSEMPDAAFSSSFVKAQCLWALGHKESGIELLKSLLKIRPRFKNGEALLRSWLGISHEL